MLDEIVLVCRGMLFAVGMATLDRLVYAIPCRHGARLKVERWLVLFLVAPCALIAGLRLGVAIVVPYSAAFVSSRSPDAPFGAVAADAALRATSTAADESARRQRDLWYSDGDDEDEYGGADTQLDVGDVLWDFGDDNDGDGDANDADGDDDQGADASERTRSPPKITVPPKRAPSGVDSSHVAARASAVRPANARRRRHVHQRAEEPPVDRDHDSTDPDNVKLRTYLLSALLTGSAVIAEIARNSPAPRPFPIVSTLAVLGMWTAATGVWVPRVSRHSSLADAVWVLDGFVSALGFSALTYVHDSLTASVAEAHLEWSRSPSLSSSSSRLGANHAVISVAPASRARFFAQLF